MEQRIIDFEPIEAYGFCELEPNTLQVGYRWPKTKSHLRVGNMVIHNTHRFNWLEHKMWKLFFGFEIENVEEN